MSINNPLELAALLEHTAGVLRELAPKPDQPTRPPVEVRIKQLAAAKMGTRKIAAVLHHEGYRLEDGGHWKASSVREALRNQPTTNP